MKRISFEEFRDRVGAVTRARRIFIPYLTKNITIAFELYQEVLAEQERDRFLTTITGGRTPMTWLDQYKRPKCPECQEPLYLRVITVVKGLGNQEGWKTCWECIGPSCIYEEYSKKSIGEWMKELKKSERRI